MPSSETYLLADNSPPVEAKHEDPTAKLLEWLVKHWNQPSITLRDVYRHGPNHLRNDKNTTLRLTQILEDRGWLVPTQTWRRDKREWKIARGLPLP
jgi:hypothetical protein